MQPAQDALAKDLAALNFSNPARPIAANVDARLVTKADDARDCLVRQVTGSVRWVECIKLLAAQDITHFIEVGPGKVLSGLNRQILGKDSAIPTLNVEDSASLEKTLQLLSSPPQ
jgi:[acyl-carrier-protein] S-malonyltransferase